MPVTTTRPLTLQAKAAGLRESDPEPRHERCHRTRLDVQRPAPRGEQLFILDLCGGAGGGMQIHARSL